MNSFLIEVRKLITAEYGSKYDPSEDVIYEDGRQHDNYIRDVHVFGIYEGRLIEYQEDPIVKNGYAKDLPYLRVVHYHKG